jgi:hypothetical protein
MHRGVDLAGSGSARQRLVANVRLPGKENVRVSSYRLIAGILFLVAGALAFFGLDADASLPVAAGLAVVGIALMASSRRKPQ